MCLFDKIISVSWWYRNHILPYVVQWAYILRVYSTEVFAKFVV